MATDNTFYIDTSLFSTATAVWSDAALTTKAVDGWYQAPVEGVITYRQQTSGVLGAITNCVCTASCDTPISANGETGNYVIDIDTGDTVTDVGAIVVYFTAQDVPDGILATYDSVTYNTLTSNAFGLEIATAGELNFVGRTLVGGCQASDLEGSTTSVDNFAYDGSGFSTDGTTTSIVIPASGTVNLNATGNLWYTLVIPKPIATPSTLNLQMVGVCGGTVFAFKAFCPVALPSFATNSVEASGSLACSATQDQTYYFVHNSSTSGGITPVIDINTIPQVGNFVYSDNTGATALVNGFYKLSATTVAQVVSGVVTAITTCPSGTAYNSSTVYASVVLTCPATVDQIYYHSGAGALPTTGDTAWSDDGVTILTDGYYKLDGTTYYEINGGTGNVVGPTNFAFATAFSTSTSQGNSTSACGSSLTVTLYHDGGAALPVVSDVVYQDACKSTVIGNGYRLISTAGDGTYMYITGGAGVVSAVTSCPSITSYNSSTDNVSVPLACADTVDQTYYHSGAGALPTSGDTAWSDSGATTILTNGYYKLDATSYYEINGGTGNVAGPYSFALGTAFSSSDVQVTSTAACGDTLTETYYYNGSGLLPAASDVCYSDACKSTTLGNGFYKISTVGNGSYIEITGGAGVVASVTTCPTPLTSWSSSAGSSFGAVCSTTIDQTYYHDGAGVFPAAADHCYSDSAGTTPLGSVTPYYRFMNTVPITPVSTFLIITGSAGEVASVTACP